MDSGFTDEDLAAFDRLVGRLRALPADAPARLRAEQVAASFTRDGRLGRRKIRGEQRIVADAAVTSATATGAADRREDAPLDSGAVPVRPAGTLARARRCYICKTRYRQVDAFYHLLCPECATENRSRRALSTDLSGRRALLTGGRVKIGFQLALMMLRDGAELVVTTRFPHDTLRRFRAVEDSPKWLDRLTVAAVDLRDPRQVLGLCEQLRETGEPLDILINNAAQTVRRPPRSYASLAAGSTEHCPPVCSVPPVMHR